MYKSKVLFHSNSQALRRGAIFMFPILMSGTSRERSAAR
nr:MAG TPA: hypothetical protein [Caudoviricetes sp.]